jgi:hypothetical protein
MRYSDCLVIADDRPEPASSQRTIQHRRLACSKVACFTKLAEFDEQYACCERVFRAVRQTAISTEKETRCHCTKM